jgi:sugar phosphate isomerase/epimerase
MKLGFWTLGMPQWTNEELAQQAAAFGYHGVDLRCTRPENGKPSGGGNLCIESTEEEVEGTRVAFERAGVEIASLHCYLPGGHADSSFDWDWFESDIAAHAALAERVGSPRIRILLGTPAEGTTWGEHFVRLWEAAQAGLKDSSDVSILFENHTGTASAGQLLEKAAEVGDPRIGVEFSPDHSVIMQEDISELLDRFTPQMFHIAIADRLLVEEDLGKFDGEYYQVRYAPAMIGEGDVPFGKIFRRLEQNGYDGYLTLKWEFSGGSSAARRSGDEVLPLFADFIRGFGIIEE